MSVGSPMSGSTIVPKTTLFTTDSPATQTNSAVPYPTTCVSVAVSVHTASCPSTVTETG
ncbi:MAG: hypothetical protein J6V72_01530 [Kiritimatiellae bacterium]|nr:hypothetical protein [Kiritimatiellia bacterium]